MNELATVTSTDVGFQKPLQQASAQYLDRLLINYDDVDEDGNDLKKGVFKLKYDGEFVYSPKARFRIFKENYQYTKYDAANQAYTCHSVIQEAPYGVKFYDTAGGERCGSPASKKNLSDEERAKYRDIKFQRQLRGLVNMTAKTPSGDEVDIENHPVLLTLAGTTFMSLNSVKLPNGDHWAQYWMDLTTVRNKSGGTVYFGIDFSLDKSSKRDLDQMDRDTNVHFASLIDAENERIMDKYAENVASPADL